MKRTIHNFVQGSADWKAYRATPNQFNASDAPAMLGESPYKSRDKLLHELATGIVDEVDAVTQRKFDDGHRFEQEDRPRAEEFIGQELYPATVSIDLGNFKLSSSLDGWTMCEIIIYEHKSKNKTIVEFANRNEIPLLYRIQMEQQLFCSGAEKCLFTASNGESDLDPVRLWYVSDASLRERLIAGWKQFAIDLANYVPPEIKPEAVAEEVEMLPSIDIRTNGQISVIHNLAVFEQKLTVFLSEKLIRKPQTDNDFATLALQIKAMKDAEEKLKLAGTSILAQIQAVDAAMRKRDSLGELVRQNRLMAEKLLDSEKERRKLEIINDVKSKLESHINEINSTIALANVGFSVIRLPSINADFIGAIKGKKTIKSLMESANDELARAKIEANRIAGVIDANLAKLNILAVGYDSLFADIQQLIVKELDYVEMVAKSRINEHKAKEQARIEAEAERLLSERAEQAVAPLQTAPEAPVVQSINPNVQAGTNASGGYFTAPVSNANAQVNSQAKGMTEYQRGLVKGLELALNIFSQCQKSGRPFNEAVTAFINSDSIPKMEQAA